MQEITFERLAELASETADDITAAGPFPWQDGGPLKVYAVPSGGVPAALAISNFIDFILVDKPIEAHIIIDDLIDSGQTSERPEFASKPFFALIDKRSWNHGDEWVRWPWDGTLEQGIESHITRLIQFAGDDPTRGGLLETPKRVAKAWKFWCSGYNVDPADVLKTFEDGAEGTDEMVVVKDIPFYSHCEHHMAPFFGRATIAYLPEGKIVGLSKLNRLVDLFGRRLQVQERMTCQIADALMNNLAPLGVGVVVKARHMCVESRGVQHSHCATVTSALRGIFKSDPTVRAEFLELARTTKEP